MVLFYTGGLMNIINGHNNSFMESMNFCFLPQSVAVIGASRDSDRELKTGWVGRLVRYQYQGKIYPINPNATEILNIKAYPSVTSVPDSIDYAIISVPSELVPGQVKDCVTKNIKVVHVYTAGFAETGTTEGKRLQDEIKEILLGSQTRLIGPNCMGVYCPASKLTFDVRFPQDSGSIAFISQTGVGGRRLINLATGRGLRFSKVVSYGNALDLNGTDFLEYITADPDTKIILLYLEGLQEGRRFFRLLQECVKEKPVVLLKAGLSESGAGAAASHTGSLAGNRQIWQALFRQTGAIPVETLEEAVDQLIALQNMLPVKGKRVGLVGRGGGIGVITSDMCEREGLSVPQFSPWIREQLQKMTEAGSTNRNPVEIGLGAKGVSKYYTDALKIVASDPLIDVVVTFLNPEDYLHYGITGWLEDIISSLVEANKNISKPLAVAILSGNDVQVFEASLNIQRKCQEAGIACFLTLDAAVKAIGKLATYYERKSGNDH
jgi:acyl-CoA synthetase (NDP forming)